jgi:hypothetical protein
MNRNVFWRAAAFVERTTVLVLAIVASIAASVAAADRAIATPALNHPGNVFLAGEEVSVRLPDLAGPWRLVDYDGRVVKEIRETKPARLGVLPIGYYELVNSAGPVNHETRITLGVLAPLKAPTPRTSPIACDVAMAWFYPKATMPAVAQLSALAGLNWVRDRLSWAEMEPQRGEIKPAGVRYDDSAAIQAAAGLQVLQVNHSSPAWANGVRKRFPLDLRDMHRYYRDVARRWNGKVLAFEPWNEADIDAFGGHTGSEIASLQKASYLGLKAGNPNVVVCQNVFAIHRPATLHDFHANQAWPYFETFNLHHYEPLEKYPALYADFRSVSAGRPLWTTECNVPVSWSGDSKLQEPTAADNRVQAERIAKIFARSIHEGAVETFFFVLPNYAEGKTQFGIIHGDLTPRPGYVALAAVGRLLADAKPLGKLKLDKPNATGFAFRAKPDGQSRIVVVAWAEKGVEPIPPFPSCLAVYDHLGRPKDAPAKTPLELSSSPLLGVLPEESLGSLALEAPPAPAARLGGKPSSVVLQAVWPANRVACEQSAYRVARGKSERIPLFVYNFGSKEITARLSARGSKNLKLVVPESVRVAAGGRAELGLVAELQGGPNSAAETATVDAECQEAGKAVLSLQLIGDGAP